MWDCFTKSEAQPDLLSELLRIASSPCYGAKQHFADYSIAAAPVSSFRLWHHIVSQYTRLRLSVPTDKLPGIAAVAQRIHASRPGDEYLCGLWRSSLAHDLLWERRYQRQYYQSYKSPANGGVTGSGYDDEPLEDPAVRLYTGPSWSWTSSSSAVTFPLDSENVVTPKLELIGFSIKLRDGNAFGRVSPGSHLIIRAPTLACSWMPAPSNCAHADRYWLRVLGRRKQVIGDVCFKLDRQRWKCWDKEAEADAVLALIGFTDSGQPRALVLHLLDNTQRYQRIGILLSPKDFMFDEVCGTLAQTFEEDGQIQTIALE